MQPTLLRQTLKVFSYTATNSLNIPLTINNNHNNCCSKMVVHFNQIFFYATKKTTTTKKEKTKTPAKKTNSPVKKVKLDVDGKIRVELKTSPNNKATEDGAKATAVPDNTYLTEYENKKFNFSFSKLICRVTVEQIKA